MYLVDVLQLKVKNNICTLLRGSQSIFGIVSSTACLGSKLKSTYKRLLKPTSGLKSTLSKLPWSPHLYKSLNKTAVVHSNDILFNEALQFCPSPWRRGKMAKLRKVTSFFSSFVHKQQGALNLALLSSGKTWSLTRGMSKYSLRISPPPQAALIALCHDVDIQPGLPNWPFCLDPIRTKAGVEIHAISFCGLSMRPPWCVYDYPSRWSLERTAACRECSMDFHGSGIVLAHV